MKRNKLAAGALALALGLGAIAPSYAADAQPTAVEEKEYTGAQLFLEKYKAELERANSLRRAAITAQANIDKAQANFDAANARLEAARKAYEALYPYAVVDEDGNPISPEVLGKVEVKEAAEALNLISDANIDYKDHIERILNGNLTLEGVKKGLDKFEANDDISEDKFETAKDRYYNALEKYINSNQPTSARLLAYKEFVAAQADYDVKKDVLADVIAANNPALEAYERALAELQKLAVGFNVTVQVGNDGIKVVDKDDDKVEVPEKELTEAQIKELRRAVADAKTTLRAVELLRELAPQKIADVKVELDALVKAQEARIARAEAILAKYDKMASLFSVAYAADEATADEVDDLIKDIDDSTDKINELIKDKEEEKPEEEKPEEEKPEEEKPAEKPAPGNKEAGKNAKTGIAGVAGVAGVLAAATAAYAASKRK